MKKYILPILILLFASVIAGLFLYARTIRMSSARGCPEKADLIVVLTGAAGRINEGVRLLDEGVAPLLFVTGVEAAGQFYLNAPGYDVKRLRMEGKVLVDSTAKNTRENAFQTKLILKKIKPTPKSILLVTSVYHIPRAVLMFRKRLSSVEICAHPVRSSNYDPNRWWKDFMGIKILVGEFFKYLGYRFFL